MDKIRFKKGAGDNVIPEGGLSQEWIDGMKPCDLVNPFAHDSKRVVVHHSVLPDPIHPEDDRFWNELVDTARFVYLSKNKISFNNKVACNDMSDYKVPHIDFSDGYLSQCMSKDLRIRNIHTLAEAVHQDYPTQFITDLILWLKKDGAKVRKDLFGQKAYKVFTDGIVLISHMAGWATHTASPSVFAAKYARGVVRPEEFIHLWAKGLVDVPEWVNDQLEALCNKSAIIKNPHSFTMYPEGCPNHPEDTPMHSAVASMSLLCKVIFEANELQENECDKNALGVAMGRTAAGVHYPSSNKNGLWFGEEIISKILPDWLAQFGADKEAVIRTIEEKRTPWLA